MEKGKKTKQKIVLVARGIINQKGMTATSVDEIINAAGITKGGFYYHFIDKQNLCMEVLRLNHNEFFELLADCQSTESAYAAFNKFFDKMIEYHCSKNFVGGCLLGNTALEMSDLSVELSAEVAKTFSMWQTSFTEIIIKGQKNHEIKNEILPEEMAAMIIEILEGALMLSRLRKSGQPFIKAIENIKTCFFI